ncbi:hypothetical protein EMIT0180MI3_60125 [Priestia megaterium]
MVSDSLKIASHLKRKYQELKIFLMLPFLKSQSSTRREKEAWKQLE